MPNATPIFKYVPFADDNYSTVATVENVDVIVNTGLKSLQKCIRVFLMRHCPRNIMYNLYCYLLFNVFFIRYRKCLKLLYNYLFIPDIDYHCEI